MLTFQSIARRPTSHVNLDEPQLMTVHLDGRPLPVRVVVDADGYSFDELDAGVWVGPVTRIGFHEPNARARLESRILDHLNLR